MTKHTLPAITPEAVAFFAEHAGTSYRPDRETPAEGAQRHARGLARAEAWLKADDDLRVDWTDDWGVDHVAEYPDAYDDEPDTCESATLTNGNVDVLASLGCIDDADDDYRRVIEAQLAYEAMPAELRCDCETPDTATCGTCGSTWCARCHPSPSDRCHWEYEHDDDDDDDDDDDESYTAVPDDSFDDMLALMRDLAALNLDVTETPSEVDGLVHRARDIVGDPTDDDDEHEARRLAGECEDCRNQPSSADDVTDAERIAHTLGKLRHWIENLDANAAHYQDDIARRATTARANDLRDVLKMLDGTEDAYIRQLRG